MKKAIVITAPSGAGKTTLVKMLLKTRADYAFSISACTRKARENEVNGRDYYFLTSDEFKQKIAANAFVEFEEVYPDMFYGTLHSEIERIWEMHKIVIFDIDVKGALAIKKQLKEQVLTIFIKPPSQAVLFNRLQGRGTETKESIQKRFDKSLVELAYEKQFDKVVVNDDLSSAFKDLLSYCDAFLEK